MIVSNSTPIIHLGKVGKLKLLQECFQKVFIPEEVYQEINALPKSIEAVLLQQALQERWMHKEKVIISAELEKFSWLDQGELHAIALAMQKKKPILIDDKVAKQVAAIFKIEVHGTIYVILKAYEKKFLNKEDAIRTVNDMMKNEFYLTSDVYALFLEELGKRNLKIV